LEKRVEKKKKGALFAAENAKSIIFRFRFNAARMKELLTLRNNAKKEINRLKEELNKINDIYTQLKRIRAYAQHTINGLIEKVKEIKGHLKHIKNIKKNMDSLNKKRVKPTYKELTKSWNNYSAYVKKNLTKPPKLIDKTLMELSNFISIVFSYLSDMVQINILFHSNELKPLVNRLYQSLTTAWNIEKRQDMLAKIGRKLVKGFQLVEELAKTVLDGESSDTKWCKKILTEIGKIQEEEMTTENSLDEDSRKESATFAKSAYALKDTYHEIEKHVQEMITERNNANSTREDIMSALSTFSTKLNEHRSKVHKEVMDTANVGETQLKMAA